jgi:hypothetical protein
LSDRVSGLSLKPTDLLIVAQLPNSQIQQNETLTDHFKASENAIPALAVEPQVWILAYGSGKALVEVPFSMNAIKVNQQICKKIEAISCEFLVTKVEHTSLEIPISYENALVSNPKDITIKFTEVEFRTCRDFLHAFDRVAPSLQSKDRRSLPVMDDPEFNSNGPELKMLCFVNRENAFKQIFQIFSDNHFKAVGNSAGVNSQIAMCDQIFIVGKTEFGKMVIPFAKKKFFEVQQSVTEAEEKAIEAKRG